MVGARYTRGMQDGKKSPNQSLKKAKQQVAQVVAVNIDDDEHFRSLFFQYVPSSHEDDIPHTTQDGMSCRDPRKEDIQTMTP